MYLTKNILIYDAFNIGHFTTVVYLNEKYVL